MIKKTSVPEPHYSHRYRKHFYRIRPSDMPDPATAIVLVVAAAVAADSTVADRQTQLRKVVSSTSDLPVVEKLADIHTPHRRFQPPEKHNPTASAACWHDYSSVSSPLGNARNDVVHYSALHQRSKVQNHPLDCGRDRPRYYPHTVSFAAAEPVAAQMPSPVAVPASWL